MGTCLSRSTRVCCVEKGLFPSFYRYEEPNQGKHCPPLNLKIFLQSMSERHVDFLFVVCSLCHKNPSQSSNLSMKLWA